MSISILDLESKLEDLQQYKEKEIVTMYPGGGLSLVAVDILTKADFTDAKSLKGRARYYIQFLICQLGLIIHPVPNQRKSFMIIVSNYIDTIWNTKS